MTTSQMTNEDLRHLSDTALGLIERLNGDVEFARHLWNEMFEEEAERIYAVYMELEATRDERIATIRQFIRMMEQKHEQA